MSTKQMESASFEELKNYKIALRRNGYKGGVRYTNVELAMKTRFGRT